MFSVSLFLFCRFLFFGGGGIGLLLIISSEDILPHIKHQVIVLTQFHLLAFIKFPARMEIYSEAGIAVNLRRMLNDYGPWEEGPGDHNPRPPHHHRDYGPLSESGSVAIVLLVLGIFAAAVTVIVVLVLFTKCSKIRVFSVKPKRPLLPAISEAHLRISRSDLLTATANLSEENLIGTGGFSSVYKGVFPNGRIVAVKWMKIDEESLARRTFLAELQILGRLRHRNLLKILGYFSGTNEMALVLEFMPNGSLENLLHGEAQRPLEWRQRLNIAMGMAQGLAYLHHEFGTTVVHCDLKPSNVLLDEDLEPRIADFGLAKMLNIHMAESSFGPFWTVGYTAPETTFHLKPSSKMDVYSFGIILLELVSKHRPTSSSFNSRLTLVEWFCKANAEGFVLDVIDEYLKTKLDVHHEILDVISLALHCAQNNPSERPTMREVVKKLAKIRASGGQSNRFNVPLQHLLAPIHTRPNPLDANYSSPSTSC